MRGRVTEHEVEHLEERAAQLAAIVDCSDDAIIGKGLDGTITSWNEAAHRLFGFTEAEAIGQSFLMLVPPDRVVEEQEILDRVRHGETVRGLETVRLRKCGGTIDVAVSVSPIVDPGGAVIGAAKVARDITDVKAAQEQLRRANAYNRNLLEASLDPLVAIGRAGKITDVNQATELVTGRSREELIGSDFSTYFTDPSAARHGYELAFEAGSVVDYELEVKHRDGSTTPVLYNATVYRDEDGHVLGVFAAARDVTRLKQAEQELRRANQELSRSNQELEQFAYVASHDLQEPLRMVSSYTQLLARRYGNHLDQDAREFIGYAVDGANRMQRLIQDLLAYSRVVTRGRAPEAVDAHEALGEAVKNLQAAIQETGALVTNGELPRVAADPGQLMQLFQNLVGNAIKFHQPGQPPRVHVAAERSDATPDAWTFLVRDNGIGIEAKYFDRLFVIFQRLHSRHEYPGTGIGLALCKRIVERHGGRVWVESAPGQGSTFFFTLGDGPPDTPRKAIST